MDLSIIIPHQNRKEPLKRCLSSIPPACTSLSYETLVVDNGSMDGSQEMLRGSFPTVALIQNRTNEGFSRATNRGLKVARGDHLLCLNNDTFLFPKSLEILVSFMKAHPDTGVAGGKILNKDGTLQPSARSFPRLETALFNRSSILSRLFPQNRFSRRYLLSDWNHDAARPVDWISGSFFMIRRNTMEKVGFFDEQFFLYCEDVDYCRRVKERGYSVYYVPEAKVIHDTRYSEKRMNTLFSHHQSMYRFYKKYHSRGILWDFAVLGGISFRFLIGTTFWMGRKLLKGNDGASS